jgi:K(+)-stimulated pyrophosphate-energized sodium pump
LLLLIYSRIYELGADLVGKVEMDIPEDDPRNPAVIADNVGDNVGDVAGMGADLFESFVGSIIAAATLADGDVVEIMLPFWIAAAGIVASVFGFFAVGTKDGASQKELLFALQKGVIVSSILVIGFSAIICWQLFEGREERGWEIFGCIVIGLIAGVMIGQVTEYFTSYSYWPVQSITDAAVTGPATVIIQGLGVGMISTVFPVLIIVATILGCNALAEEYGIAMAAVGMLSTLGVTLATDAYGPIADNAGGIAEMADLEERVRETTDALDALGNTTAATGKGFAIGSAVLTALSLLAAFKNKAAIDVVDLGDPVVLSGALIGAMLPFLFAALTMLSVQKVR